LTQGAQNLFDGIDSTQTHDISSQTYVKAGRMMGRNRLASIEQIRKTVQAAGAQNTTTCTVFHTE
jgi:hypothetical protein